MGEKVVAWIEDGGIERRPVQSGARLFVCRGGRSRGGLATGGRNVGACVDLSEGEGE